MSLPDWARAHGAPLFTGRIRTAPEDFQVTEVLEIDFSGDGEHDWLWLEKAGANTEWVARQLARHADVPAREVGYAGLKDRHAVTKQWFSVPRWHAPDWSAFTAEGVAILDVQRHRRKLRRGAHRANRFRIVVRGKVPETIDKRLIAIRERGVPNYFGEQRFGRDGANLDLADRWAAGKRLPRHKRGLAISTVRSFSFNEALDRRVRDGSWNRLSDGDTANLDGSGSVFVVENVDSELERRCAALDIHPAGMLVGAGAECDREDWRQALTRARVEAGTRSLRLRVQDLQTSSGDEALCLSFALGRGGYATAVLREVVETTSP